LLNQGVGGGPTRPRMENTNMYRLFRKKKPEKGKERLSAVNKARVDLKHLGRARKSNVKRKKRPVRGEDIVG